MTCGKGRLIGLIRRLCAAAALLPALAGCGKDPAPPIRIGTTPWPGTEFFHLAAEKGFFVAEGVSVQFVELATTGDLRRAYERRQIDLVPVTNVEVALIRGQSERRPKVFCVIDYSNGADMLIARAPIDSVQGLRGKRVAIEPGTLDVVAVAAAFRSVGMTINDVTLVPMPQDRTPKAFLSGEVDAVETYPPFATEVLKGEGARKLFDSSRVPGAIVDLCACEPELLAQRADDLSRVLRALDRAYRYAKEHPDDACAYMGAREQISGEEFKNALAGVRIVPLDEQAEFLKPGGRLEQALKETGEVLRQAGLLKESPPLADCVDESVVRRSLKR